MKANHDEAHERARSELPAEARRLAPRWHVIVDGCLACDEERWRFVEEIGPDVFTDHGYYDCPVEALAFARSIPNGG